MQNENFFKRALRFAESKGFYMILGLCVVAIGVSAYVLFFTTPEQEGLTGQLIAEEPQAGVSNTVPDVTLPKDDEKEEDDDKGAVKVPEELNPTETPEEEDKQPVTQKPQEDSQPTVSTEPPAPAGAVQVDAQTTVKEPIFTLPIQSASIQREYSGDILVKDPTMGDWRTHGGTDFICDEGDTVMAVLDGAVSEIFQDAMMGQCIRIDHGSGLESLYCGLVVQDNLKVGQQVSVGQTIGRAANSVLAESAQECHLHLEMTEDGLPVDPMTVLK